MKTEIVVPQIGEAVAELTLTTWLRQVGDSVKKGDVLFEIDSDKAIVEVEAFVEGKLVQILAPNGSTVLPQDVVAYVETETVSAHTAPPPAEPQTNGKSDTNKASPLAQRVATELGIDLTTVSGSGRNGRILREDLRQQTINASPKARRLAQAQQIDIRAITASANDGMIRVADLPASQSAPSAPLPAPAKLRQVIAQRTQQSKQTVPHFYLMVDVDMTEVNALRNHCRARLHWGKAPTYTDLLLRACASALVDVPAVNVVYQDSGVVSRNGVSIGVAVNSPEGLRVPVIPDVDRLSLRQVSSALAESAERARAGRLKPSDMGDKSLVVSNLGMYSVDAFIAIIDQPDPMILAVGRVADRVVPHNGVAAIRPFCTLTLSVDHRALDGVQAAQFLERIKDHLEHPYVLMGVAT